MAIIITLISIWLATGAVALVRRLMGWRICPICAGVLLTWLWQLIGVVTHQLPIANYQLPLAILMSGSVVGIAYQAEQKFQLSAWRGLWWKMIWIPAGFGVVHAVAMGKWEMAGIGALALVIIAISFLSGASQAGHDHAVQKLEKEMDKCC